MWPWGHLAFGYALYSGSRRLTRGDAPTGATTAVLALGALLPDLVDKPLSWTLGVFPTGYGVAHSVFVAVPVVAAAVVAAHRREAVQVGLAFGVGYLSHLAGDLLFGAFEGLPAHVLAGKVLWPVVTLSGYAVDRSFTGRLGYYLVRYLHHLLAGGLDPLVLAYLGWFVVVFALWLVDGAPVLADIVRWASRTLSSREPAER